MKELDLQQIKNIELNLLIEFDKLCKENNLYYSLCGGTMLGAVRHKGFIPWDDDIDVMMPRPDYDRLLDMVDVNRDNFPNYIEIANWKDETLKYPFIKLLDTRTVIDSLYTDGTDTKIWIDIFPVDGNPANDKELKKLQKKAEFLRRIICLKMARLGEGKSAIKRKLKPLLKKIVASINMKNLCRRLDDISKKYSFEESKYAGIVLWGLYGKGERINKEKFMKPIQIEFEGYSFNAMSNYDEYLSGIYGDYMQLPPEDKRKTHDMKAYMLEEING